MNIFKRVRVALFEYMSKEFRVALHSLMDAIGNYIATERADTLAREQALNECITALETKLAASEHMLLTYCCHLDRSGRRVLAAPRLNPVEESTLEQVRARFGSH